MKLPLSFYQRDDVILIAKELLGKYLYTNIDGKITGGMIVETEAYNGPDDRGSHAYNNKRTPRNEMMYNHGGVVYMYICYGIHDMLNIVTGTEDSSHAVLIRAIEPLTGIETMRERRNLFSNDNRLCQGPGALGKALGLNKSHNGIGLQYDIIWMDDVGLAFTEDQVKASPRVGMNFEGPYKTIPWRFYLKGNKFVSKPHS
ncbi:MAG: DNA-3-methyladenine glycosylase [Sphingobacteriales bacterium]|nr:DNA-3-methyladenine glycosylase [Sphingobacteriales bacterium]